MGVINKVGLESIGGYVAYTIRAYPDKLSLQLLNMPQAAFLQCWAYLQSLDKKRIESITQAESFDLALAVTESDLVNLWKVNQGVEFGLITFPEKRIPLPNIARSRSCIRRRFSSRLL